MDFFQRKYRSFLRRYDAPRYNDIILRPKNVIHDGALALGSKAAIYLIFPKSGVLKSHLLALQYMIDNGYSPIVVSNLPLSDDDIDQLRSLTCRILRRENFGYDFGGYREAILVFQDQIKSLDHLALFNDSVWFPVQNTRSWLKDAESAEKDLMGAISHVDMGNDELREALALLSDQSGNPPEDPQKIIDPQSWFDEFSNVLIDYKLPPKAVVAARNLLRRRRIGKSDIKFHYCSFALLLGANILRDSRFFVFWKNLKITDHWKQTIIRGEIGFTQWAIKHGFSHGCTVDRDRITQNIARLDDANLLKYLHKMTPIGYNRAFLQLYSQQSRVRRQPSSFTENDKRHFMSTIMRISSNAYIVPYYLHHEHNFQFFKKKNFSVTTFGRKIAIDMIADMPEPIKSEMWAIVEKTKPANTQTKSKIRGKRRVFGVRLRLPRFWG